MRRPSIVHPVWSSLSLSIAIVATQAVHAEGPQGVEYFETHIRPVLVEYCYECHRSDMPQAKASLTLDTAAGLLKGGDSGPALVTGKPDESLLLDALRYESGSRLDKPWRSLVVSKVNNDETIDCFSYSVAHVSSHSASDFAGRFKRLRFCCGPC